ncbi:hypothetical protein CDL12_30568 [Handroanthus impetiginosus]|uniref:Uncharacterized protein n=1 Tax=Handroanthus impetiginosus TaxID=429701 RepID=A0A2G9FVK2_9LAMI|nr:hypothetical protein CDL12_30568 [Handroanthus impetiginosus]
MWDQFLLQVWKASSSTLVPLRHYYNVLRMVLQNCYSSYLHHIRYFFLDLGDQQTEANYQVSTRLDAYFYIWKNFGRLILYSSPCYLIILHINEVSIRDNLLKYR